MSEKPISVGDLVIMVRACCEQSGIYLGSIKIVEGICNSDLSGPCTNCGFRPIPPYAVMSMPSNNAVPFRWLKRLDPDALKDDVPTREELTA